MAALVVTGTNMEGGKDTIGTIWAIYRDGRRELLQLLHRETLSQDANGVNTPVLPVLQIQLSKKL